MLPEQGHDVSRVEPMHFLFHVFVQTRENCAAGHVIFAYILQYSQEPLKGFVGKFLMIAPEVAAKMLK